VEVILRHLSGQARAEVLALEENGRATVEGVLTYLTEQFADHRPLSSLLSAFTDRRQQPGESLRAFSNGLLNLAKTVRAKDAALAPDVLLRERFCLGVTDPALRNALEDWLLDHPEATFEEVRQRAMRRTREGELQPVAAHQQIRARESDELAALKQQIATLTENMAAMQAAVTSLATAKTEQSYEEQRRLPPGGGRGRGMRQFSGRCYRCHRIGHRAAECQSSGNGRPLP
jgi:hypothetical protein